MRIVVTNDDGLRSPGLRLLYEAVKGFGEAIIVAPLEQASARGGMLTLDEPIRVYEVDLGYAKAYGITGSPRDVVHVAREVLGGADVLVSGVNAGENTSIQNILVSGTVGAAAEAALFGMPAAAFSADVEGFDAFLREDYAMLVEAAVKAVVGYLLERSLPEGVDVLNVNIPRTFSGVVRVVPPARLRWVERLERRLDPRGKPYYWLYGEAVKPEPGTDSYVVFKEKGVALTPLSLSMRVVDGAVLEELAGRVAAAIGRKS